MLFIQVRTHEAREEWINPLLCHRIRSTKEGHAVMYFINGDTLESGELTADVLQRLRTATSDDDTLYDRAETVDQMVERLETDLAAARELRNRRIAEQEAADQAKAGG